MTHRTELREKVDDLFRKEDASIGCEFEEVCLPTSVGGGTAFEYYSAFSRRYSMFGDELCSPNLGLSAPICSPVIRDIFSVIIIYYVSLFFLLLSSLLGRTTLLTGRFSFQFPIHHQRPSRGSPSFEDLDLSDLEQEDPDAFEIARSEFLRGKNASSLHGENQRIVDAVVSSFINEESASNINPDISSCVQLEVTFSADISMPRFSGSELTVENPLTCASNSDVNRIHAVEDETSVEADFVRSNTKYFPSLPMISTCRGLFDSMEAITMEGHDDTKSICLPCQQENDFSSHPSVPESSIHLECENDRGRNASHTCPDVRLRSMEDDMLALTDETVSDVADGVKGAFRTCRVLRSLTSSLFPSVSETVLTAASGLFFFFFLPFRKVFLFFRLRPLFHLRVVCI